MATESGQDGSNQSDIARRGFMLVYAPSIIPFLEVPSRPGHNLLFAVGTWRLEVPFTTWAPGVLNLLSNWVDGMK